MSVQEKQKQWTHPRHAVVTKLAKPVLTLYSRWRYGVTVEPFQQQGDRPYLVLYNHQTPFDQFFVGMAFRGADYYMATEDIFSNGFISKVIKFLVAPIPITDAKTGTQFTKLVSLPDEDGNVRIERLFQPKYPYEYLGRGDGKFKPDDLRKAAAEFFR